MSMFCNQCQETAKNTGCTIKGVCGKTDDVSRMHDLLVYTTKGLSFVAVEARKQGLATAEADRSIVKSLFMTHHQR